MQARSSTHTHTSLVGSGAVAGQQGVARWPVIDDLPRAFLQPMTHLGALAMSIISSLWLSGLDVLLIKSGKITHNTIPSPLARARTHRRGTIFKEQVMDPNFFVTHTIAENVVTVKVIANGRVGYLCGVSHIKPERKKSNAMQWSARIEECLPLLFGA